jgi:hypothetical protein
MNGIIKMSWSKVQEFQNLETTTPSDVVRLEKAFNDILNSLDSNQCHMEAGYSESFPRYMCEISEDDDHKKITKRLRRHYWARYKQLEALDRQIKTREDKLRVVCEHVWEKDYESRDHRSRYDCRKCGAYR